VKFMVSRFLFVRGCSRVNKQPVRQLKRRASPGR